MQLYGMFFNLQSGQLMKDTTSKTEDLANFEPLTEGEFDALVLNTIKNYNK
jgi:hypothetical protein